MNRCLNSLFKSALWLLCVPNQWGYIFLLIFIIFCELIFYRSRSELIFTTLARKKNQTKISIKLVQSNPCWWQTCSEIKCKNQLRMASEHLQLEMFSLVTVFSVKPNQPVETWHHQAGEQTLHSNRRPGEWHTFLPSDVCVCKYNHSRRVEKKHLLARKCWHIVWFPVKVPRNEVPLVWMNFETAFQCDNQPNFWTWKVMSSINADGDFFFFLFWLQVAFQWLHTSIIAKTAQSKSRGGSISTSPKRPQTTRA